MFSPAVVAFPSKLKVSFSSCWEEANVGSVKTVERVGQVGAVTGSPRRRPVSSGVVSVQVPQLIVQAR